MRVPVKLSKPKPAGAIALLMCAYSVVVCLLTNPAMAGECAVEGASRAYVLSLLVGTLSFCFAGEYWGE